MEIAACIVVLILGRLLALKGYGWWGVAVWALIPAAPLAWLLLPTATGYERLLALGTAYALGWFATAAFLWAISPLFLD